MPTRPTTVAVSAADGVDLWSVAAAVGTVVGAAAAAWFLLSVSARIGYQVRQRDGLGA